MVDFFRIRCFDLFYGLSAFFFLDEGPYVNDVGYSTVIYGSQILLHNQNIFFSFNFILSIKFEGF